MKKIILTTLFATVIPVAAQADLLFTVGAKASLWMPDVAGKMGDQVSVEDDGLNLKADNGTQLTAYFKHPVPFVPNIQIKNTQLAINGDGKITKEFLGKKFDGSIESKLNLSHTDLTLIWGLPISLPFVDINFGLTARKFDGEVSATGQVAGVKTEGKKVTLDFVMPMLFGHVGINAPFGFYADADANYIGYGKNKLMDVSANVGYELPVPVVDLGLEAGYRIMQLQTDKDTADIETDVSIKGAYVGAALAFGF